MITAELSENGERIVCSPVEYRHKELLKAIPGSSWIGGSSWDVPRTWSSCLALRSTFGTTLEIGPGLTRWAYSYRERVLDPAWNLRDAVELPADWPNPREDEDLFPHQQTDVAFLSTVQRALLTSEVGLGKTAAVIRTLHAVAREGVPVFPALIVAPKSVKVPWKREFHRWWPAVNVTPVKGSAAQRRKQLTTPADVYVMNYESIRTHSRIAPYGSYSLTKCVEHGGVDEAITPAKCQVHLKELNRIHFRAVVADEAHRLKDPSSLQTRSIMAASKTAEVRLGLTGTPVANNVVDLWSLLHFIDPEEWPTKTKWIDRFVDLLVNPFGGIVVSGVKQDMRAEFDATVLPRMRRMTKEVVMPFLPPVIEERRDVEMTPKQAKAYKQMTDSMLAGLDTGTLVTTSPLIQTMRLLQLASSYGVLEDVPPQEDEVIPRNKLILTAPSSKIDAFLEDLPDFAGRSMIVFAVSRQLIMLLSEALKKQQIEHGLIVGGQTEIIRQENIDAFQRGDTKLILVTVGAGGTGITLTAADTAVYLQRSWSAIEMEQAAGRYHRIGSERHNSILRVDYVTPCPVEEAVIATLNGKAASLEDIVRDADLLRKMLKGELT